MPPMTVPQHPTKDQYQRRSPPTTLQMCGTWAEGASNKYMKLLRAFPDVTRHQNSQQPMQGCSKHQFYAQPYDIMGFSQKPFTLRMAIQAREESTRILQRQLNGLRSMSYYK